MAVAGVNVAGYFRAEAGVGEAARLLVASLKAAGVPYALVPVTRIPTRQRSAWQDDAPARALYDTNIVCVNADQLPAFVADVGPSFLDGRYTIGMWWWEVEAFPEWMRVPASLIDEVWVGSSHTAAAIGAAVDVPVFVCPPAITPPRPEPVDLARLGIDGRPFLLFCFDFNSDFERKNPLGTLAAFERAFAPGEGPALVLKSVNGAQRPRDLETLRAAAAGRDDVHVLDVHLDAGELHGLMAACTAYVSLHRAEGFGLTIAEAIALGKPAVATAYSGNLDFMSSETSYLVPYELVEIPPGCDPYPAGGRWAEPDVDAAADALRRIWAHPEEAAQRAGRARDELLATHTPEARAKSLLARLEEVSTLAPRPRPRILTHDQPARDRLAADLWTLHALPDLHATLSSARLSRVRRLVGRVLFPLVHRQTEYNIAAMRVIESLRADVARLTERLDRLERPPDDDRA